MLRRSLLASSIVAGSAVPALDRGVTEVPPPAPFKKVSTLVKLAAPKAFPSIDDIMRRKVVPSPRNSTV